MNRQNLPGIPVLESRPTSPSLSAGRRSRPAGVVKVVEESGRKSRSGESGRERGEPSPSPSADPTSRPGDTTPSPSAARRSRLGGDTKSK